MAEVASLNGLETCGHRQTTLPLGWLRSSLDPREKRDGRTAVRPNGKDESEVKSALDRFLARGAPLGRGL